MHVLFHQLGRLILKLVYIDWWVKVKNLEILFSLGPKQTPCRESKPESEKWIAKEASKWNVKYQIYPLLLPTNTYKRFIHIYSPSQLKPTHKHTAETYIYTHT